MFTKRLAEYINAQSGITGITCFAESSPSVKGTSGNQTVIVSNAGQSGFKSTTFYATIRFMVSGTAATSMSKAEELFIHFCPFGITSSSRRLLSSEYAVIRAIPGTEPALANNQGNIFWASFSLEFLVARDS